jgi:Fe-S cluster assembly iron-binding protein IscA
MITVTDRARDRLKRLISTHLGESGRSLRLASAGGAHFGLVPDAPRAGDQQVEHDGAVVLLLRHSLAVRLQGWTIDCVEAADGSDIRLRLRPGQGGLH